MSARLRKLEFSKNHAQRKLRDIAADTANVVFVRHAQQRMRQRRIDLAQVMACLRKGQITDGPYRANKSRLWRITVERFAAGEEVKLAVEFAEGFRQLLIITVFE